MRVVVAGGKLQGVEAAYLARQAGWSVVLVDRDGAAPARGLSDRFYRLDIFEDAGALAPVLKSADLVIPAIEDAAALTALEQLTRRCGVPFACDLSAYTVTSSKIRSNRFFAEQGVPAPRSWPESGFPLIAKPSEGSGSRGVEKISDEKELALFFERVGPEKDHYVIQEFLPGETYSLEVIGEPGHYLALPVTDLRFDTRYDCKRVLAPTALDPAAEKRFQDLGVQLAALLSLRGIMDVEAIDDGGTMKVLEIDARLPSQTPTALYHSSGLNILTLLYGLFVNRRVERPPRLTGPGGVVYEHIRVTPGHIETLGERIVAQAGPLTHHRDFFGADEALTDYQPGRFPWVATLIITAADRLQAWNKRCRVIENIAAG